MTSAREPESLDQSRKRSAENKAHEPLELLDLFRVFSAFALRVYLPQFFKELFRVCLTGFYPRQSRFKLIRSHVRAFRLWWAEAHPL